MAVALAAVQIWDQGREEGQERSVLQVALLGDRLLDGESCEGARERLRGRAVTGRAA